MESTEVGKEKQSQSSAMEGEKNHHEESSKVAAGSSQTPASMDRKLLVKLKIPKSTEEIEEGEIVSSPVKKSTHFCHECNKGFSSGKALGGHMSSVHVQARDKKLKLNKASKFKRDGSGYLSDAGGSSNSKQILCPICGKDFRSRKSLFGHMRCHPEREWRGMEPPKESHKISDNLSGSFSADDEDQDAYDGNESPEPDHQIDNQVDSAARVMNTDMVDLTESLSSWTVTGKRGRECLKSFIHPLRDPPLSPDEEKKLYDAVDHLITLVNGHSLRPNNHPEEGGIDPVEDVNGGSGSRRETVEVQPAARKRRNFSLKQRRFIETASTDSEKTIDGVSDLGKGKGKTLMEPEFSGNKLLSTELKDINFSAHELDSIKSELQNHTIVVKNKGKRQKVKSMVSETGGEITPVDQKMDGPVTGVTPENYKCSTCGKTFSTHQALGGHRSSHNKLKINVLNTADELPSPSPVDNDINHAYSVSHLLETNEIEGADGSKLAESIHQCEICDRTFSTGQALGGHKRCHWPGSSSQVASSGEETETSVRKVLNFDLNEPPQTEDAKNDDSGNAAGYASCS